MESIIQLLAQLRQREKESTRGPKRQEILIVDDVPSNRELLQQTLDPQGYENHRRFLLPKLACRLSRSLALT